MDVTAFQRVLVAGFISGGTDDVDANLETVRLLRSQLRSKSHAARDRSGSAAAGRNRRGREQRRRQRHAITTTSTGVTPISAAADRRHGAAGRAGAGGSAQAGAGIRNEKDLAKYDRDFRRRRVLEEARRGIPDAADRHRHGALHAAPGQRLRDAEPRGLRLVRPPQRRSRCAPTRSARASSCSRGSSSSTAAPARSSTRRRSTRKSSTTRSRACPALSSYFELMDRVMPRFLSTLSAQKIRGTRVLLK